MAVLLATGGASSEARAEPPSDQHAGAPATAPTPAPSGSPRSNATTEPAMPTSTGRPSGAEQPAKAAAAQASDGTVDSALRTTAYVGFAVAGAGVLTGIITGSIALSRTNTLKGECPSNRCPPSRQGDINSAKNFTGAATVSFAVAALGAAVGVVTLLLSKKPEVSPRTSTARVRVQPVVGLGALGLMGRF